MSQQQYHLYLQWHVSLVSRILTQTHRPFLYFFICFERFIDCLREYIPLKTHSVRVYAQYICVCVRVCLCQVSIFPFWIDVRLFIFFQHGIAKGIYVSITWYVCSLSGAIIYLFIVLYFSFWLLLLHVYVFIQFCIHTFIYLIIQSFNWIHEFFFSNLICYKFTSFLCD